MDVYWGDAHLNLEGNNFHLIDDVFAAARRNLDFFPIAYYPFYWYAQSGLPDVIASGEGFQGGEKGLNALPIETVGNRRRFDDEWKILTEKVRTSHVSGEFVTFPGYEWHGNRRRWGDHNIFFKETGYLLYPSTLSELYELLDKHDGIAIPHHTAYQMGERGKDWHVFREDLSPFAEVYSIHGSSEGIDTPAPMSSNQSMGPRVSAGSIQAGLNQGRRFGIIASSDRNLYPGEWGCGLMGVFAEELTRDALWHAFKTRRVFGVTGDRIVPSFEINGQPMGSIISSDVVDEPPTLTASITGSHAIDRVEVISNGKPITTHTFSNRMHTGPSASEKYKIRIQCGWGTDITRGFPNHPVHWECRLQLLNGQIVSIEPCFTNYGQVLKYTDEDTVEWKLETTRQSGGHFGDRYPSVIVEFRGTLKTQLHLTINGQTYAESIETLRSEAKVFALYDSVEAEIKTVFGLAKEDIENPDHFWHYAPKVKIHRVIAEDEYTADFEQVLDSSDNRGYYYLRISQTNRQMAWTSPIWIESARENRP